MDILYWYCLGYIIVQALVYFYRMLKDGLSGCATTASRIGAFIGSTSGIAAWIGAIYFYLH